MSVHPFGQLPNGEEISEIRLATAAGASASIITFGAAVRDFIAPLPDGGRRRAVLGYPTLDGYLSNEAYLGVTVGRHASRISGGRFTLDDETYALSLNDRGRHHLHGGAVGFSHRPWRLSAADASSALLALTSPDGDQGYPGTVEAQCLYRLIEPATLRVVMTATTDAPTLVAFAHHSYFTLAPGESVRDHRLKVNARTHTPFDELIPTGEICSVADTPYDLRRLRPLAEAAGDPAFTYDMIFVLDRDPRNETPAAILQSPDAVLEMEVRTTEPCLIVYDGANLRPDGLGLDRQPHFAHAGVCLEPMRFPDSQNVPWFKSSVLRPGELYRQVTEYRFRWPS
jgi:aldose 1-epimerase